VCIAFEICATSFSVLLFIFITLPVLFQESLSLVRNNLRDIHQDVFEMSNLRVLICRHNKIKNAGVPSQLFHLEDLSVVVRLCNLFLFYLVLMLQMCC